ncbi:hypothetical protein ECZU24_00160 [Escherichia coli]|nr:hypothetical protein ECZU24_00160 [Escherichia coli]
MAYDQIIRVTTLTRPTRCVCGVRKPVAKLTSVNSTWVTTSRQWKIKTTRERISRTVSGRLHLLGRELRLRQEYFLVSSTIQDILSRHYQLHKTYDNLADKIAIHLNDTHPVLSIPELMRLLIDEHQFSWDDAFGVCCEVFSYTNHTLMSEALETWPVDMLGKILPRHLQIIFEINDYFLKTLQEQYPNDTDLLGRASIIDESNGRRVRMAWLAVVVSHKVNGVSELHSNLMVQSLFADFAKIFPGRFTNVTNGVTPRRWLAVANPSLSAVLDEHGP